MLLLTAVLATTSIVLVSIYPPHKKLVLNLTASMPRGLYLLRLKGAPQAGDLVILRLPPHAAEIAVARAYLRSNQPALKRVVATAGDRVCRFGPSVSINGKHVAIARSSDRTHQPLPSWTGCHRLRTHELMVLGAAAGSFDSRYFGVVERSAIIRIVEPLWTIRN